MIIFQMISLVTKTGINKKLRAKVFWFYQHGHCNGNAIKCFTLPA